MNPIIGIDHGNAAMKTAHFTFPSGVTTFAHEPYTAENLLEYEGQYHLCGSSRRPLLRDKTESDRFRLLTLAAIAKELRHRGLPTESEIVIAAGLPLTSFGRQKKSFKEYLLRGGEPVSFVLERSSYKITVKDVFLLPQGYAALLLALLRNHKRVYGKARLSQLFRQTRDLRVFHLTRDQYSAFRRGNRRHKILYAAYADREKPHGAVELIVPATELDRLNASLEKIGAFPNEPNPARTTDKEEHALKKDSRSGRDSRNTRPLPNKDLRRNTSSRTTSERLSILKRLETIRAKHRSQPVPAPTVTRQNPAKQR